MSPDVERFRLRAFLDALAFDGEVETHDAPLDLADLPGLIDGVSKAVLFRAVGPERQELVANVAGSRRRLARAFGVAPEALTREAQRRLANKGEIVEVAPEAAPVQQVVLRGERRTS